MLLKQAVFQIISATVIQGTMFNFENSLISQTSYIFSSKSSSKNDRLE